MAQKALLHACDKKICTFPCAMSLKGSYTWAWASKMPYYMHAASDHLASNCLFGLVCCCVVLYFLFFTRPVNSFSLFFCFCLFVSLF